METETWPKAADSPLFLISDEVVRNKPSGCCHYSCHYYYYCLNSKMCSFASLSSQSSINPQ